MTLVNRVARSCMQGVGGKKSARIVMWACYIVSLRWHFSLGGWQITRSWSHELTGIGL